MPDSLRTCKKRSRQEGLACGGEMHIYKAAWLTHEAEPVFSVDVHPDGSR